MPRKLLVADDSVTIQRVIELTFQDEDVEVVAVGDGRRAIEHIQSERPDIVLADIGMPEKDGYEVSAFVKQHPALKHIPVLLLTGAFEPVDEKRARASGCDGVLVKPFEPQLVISRVRELLSGQPQPAAWSVAPRTTQEAPRESQTSAPWAVEDRPRAADGALPGSAAVGAPARGDALDQYLDRLDAAFSNGSVPAAREASLGNMDRVDARQEPPGPGDDPVSAPQWNPFPDDLPPLPVERSGRAPDASVSAPAPAAGDPGATLAEAFAALLAAEQGHSVPAPYSSQPASPWRPASAGLSPSHSRGADDAALVEEVSRLVLERLTDRVVRDTVTDVTLKVAERLVREEIQKIKERAEGR